MGAVPNFGDLRRDPNLANYPLAGSDLVSVVTNT